MAGHFPWTQVGQISGHTKSVALLDFEPQDTWIELIQQVLV